MVIVAKRNITKSIRKEYMTKERRKKAMKADQEMRQAHLKGDFCQPNDPRIDF